MRWLSSSSDQPSFTAGVIVIQRTPDSTGPSADADSSGSPEEQPTSPAPPLDAPAVDDDLDQLLTDYLAKHPKCYYGGTVNCRVCGHCRARYKPNCDHLRGVWCACVKYAPAPDDDPTVMHEHVVEETY